MVSFHSVHKIRTSFSFILIFIGCVISPMVLGQNRSIEIFQDKNTFGLRLSDTKKTILSPIFRKIAEPVNAIFPVQNFTGMWGFYLAEKEISTCQFDNFRFLQAPYILAQKNYRWGLLDYTGNILIPFRYQNIRDVIPPEAKVKLYNQWTVRDTTNTIIKLFEMDSVQYMGGNIYKYCLAGRFGLMDIDEKIISTENYSLFTVEKKNHSMEFVEETQKEKSGDSTLYLKFKHKFTALFPFSEGLSRFLQDGKFGFIDSIGDIVLVNRYDNARDFKQGRAAVKLIGKWGFVDQQEKIIVQPYYDEVSDFKNGFAVVRRGNHKNFISLSGKEVHSIDFDEILPITKHLYKIDRAGKKGICRLNGSEIISCKYEEIIPLKSNYFIVKEHGLFGVINLSGNIIIPINFKSIQYDADKIRFITHEEGRTMTVKY